jgi:2-oxo-3-hexenedioate decarboxylase
MIDPVSLAHELRDAYANRRLVAPPSSRDAAFDLTAAYAVERELVRMRRAAGHRTVGRKVGFANKAMWRALKLETLVWGSMYDDTVHDAENGAAVVSIARMISPKIEPEIIFRLKQPVTIGAPDAAAVLASVDWIALGFEIIDCVFHDRKYQPVDFVAAYGMHAALIVGEPRTVTADVIPTLVEQLPKFTVKLLRDGAVVDEGSGRASLRSPALCLGELASAIAKRSDQEPLAAGELISTGTLTESQFIRAGETWRAEVEGIELAPVTLTLG